MKKILLRDVATGDLFSRCIEGYVYTRGDEVYTNNGTDYVYCYCLDSGKEYPWEEYTWVYLQYRAIKEVKSMEILTVYKALALEEGVLKSIWAGTASHRGGTRLEYKEGEITYAPEGSMGVFIDSTLAEAIQSGQGNYGKQYGDAGVLVVHEVIPLGTHMQENRGGVMRSPRYPAILLGREVWREEVPCPFKEGDRVQFKAGITQLGISVPAYLMGKVGTYRGKSSEGNAKVTFEEDTIPWFCLFDDLELAPKEEWVDVTEECTIILKESNEGEYYLHLHHCGHWLIELGLGGCTVYGGKEGVEANGYKVMRGGRSASVFHYFQVLKKVTR